MPSSDPIRPGDGTSRPGPLPERLRADLTRAMKEGDQRSVNVLRTTLAAIANAEAPPPPPTTPTPVVGQLVEHPRLDLTPAEVDQIVRDEIADREDTISRYLVGGRPAEAAPLEQELAILRTYLS